MKTVLFVLISLLSIAHPVFSDDSLTDLRCNSGLIMIGESKLEIPSKCGEPAGKETSERRVASSPGPVYVTVEEWTYNFGQQDFIYILEFQEATVKAIRRVGRGF